MSVTGEGVPGGATISSITDGTHFVLSAAATATAAGLTLIASGLDDSYFSTPFERVLFNLAVDDKQFVSGTTFQLLFGVIVQLFNADIDAAQWVLAIEQGAFAGATDGPPNTYGWNLSDVTWNTATPLVRYRLWATSDAQQHFFGCNVKNAAGVFTANGLYYNRIVAANAAAPASANFALRARLLNFSPKGSVANARGWLSYQLNASPVNNLLQATIQ
jgi:hypothetical protein